MLGKKYTIKDVDTLSGHENLRAGNSNYIIGRCGRVVVDGKEVGFIGEVAPRVLKNWKIKLPTVAMEIDLDWLF